MIQARIGKQTYQFPESWDEITIRDMVGYQQISQPSVWEKLKDLEGEEFDNAVKQTGPLDYLEVIEYMAKVVACFGKIPADVIEQTAQADCMAMYGYMSKLLSDPPVDGDAESFEFQGETYYMPQMEDIRILGMNRKQPQISVGEFVEAAQFEAMVDKLQKSNYEAMAGIMAILCRKKDEPFARNLIVDRQEMFMDAPVSAALQTSFFLAKRSGEYANNLRHSGAGLRRSTSGPVRIAIPNLTAGTAYYNLLRTAVDLISPTAAPWNRRRRRRFMKRWSTLASRDQDRKYKRTGKGSQQKMHEESGKP